MMTTRQPKVGVEKSGSAGVWESGRVGERGSGGVGAPTLPHSRTPKLPHAHTPTPPAQPAWRQTPVKPRPQANRKQMTIPAASFPVSRRGVEPATCRRLRLPRIRVRVTRRGALAAGLVLAVAALLSQIWLNEAFRVHTAQVRGATRVAAEEIYQASAVEGRSIFQLRPAVVASQVSQTPGVISATVHLRLPAEVVIDVAESQPWIAWKIITDTLWLAADGVTRVPVAGPPPAFTLVDETGAAMDGAGRLKPYVYASLKTLQAAHPELGAFYYGLQEGLFYRAPEGWTVYLGDTGQMAPRLALLQAVQNDPTVRSKRPEVIDLRVEGRAEIR